MFCVAEKCMYSNNICQQYYEHVFMPTQEMFITDFNTLLDIFKLKVAKHCYTVLRELSLSVDS